MTFGRMLCLLAPLVAVACDLPRDPGSTLEQVRGGTLRVGIVAHAPWTGYEDDEASGAEVALLREFATELGARIVWHPGAEGELMRALQHRKLDIVIAGLSADTPWRRHVALSRVYFTAYVIVGTPPGVSPPDMIAGLTVAVSEDDAATAAYVEEAGGIPVPVDDLAAAHGLAAAPAWKLPVLGLVPAGISLHKSQHVMAVPPGENGFLLRLDRFLHGRKGDVRQLLSRAAP